jgi:hypothetical protein
LAIGKLVSDYRPFVFSVEGGEEGRVPAGSSFAKVIVNLRERRAKIRKKRAVLGRAKSVVCFR